MQGGGSRLLTRCSKNRGLRKILDDFQRDLGNYRGIFILENLFFCRKKFYLKKWGWRSQDKIVRKTSI